MVDIKLKKNPLSLQLDPDDFLPASEDEKKQLDIMRESTTFWKDALKRFSKNKVAMVAAVVILLVIICAFVVPNFYPYEYDQQIRGSENLWPMQYSEEEQALIDSGESVFPHIFGTDKLGRDLGIRVLTGARVSLLVGLIASALVLLIGSIYGSVAGYFGGKVDLIMMYWHVDRNRHAADSFRNLHRGVSKLPGARCCSSDGKPWLSRLGCDQQH